MSEAKTLIGLGILGVGGYYLGNVLGWWGSAAIPSAAQAPPTTSPAANVPAAPAAPQTPLNVSAVPQTPAACSLTPTGQMIALTAALQKAAGVNSLTVSQWNYYVDQIAPGNGAAQLPQYGTNNIDAVTYVCARTQAGFAIPDATQAGATQTTRTQTQTGATGLTAADAATYPYSGAVTSDQMSSISQTLMPQLKAGQIPSIGGESVLAYMLGWGGLPAGTSKTVSGETYMYDGTNWNLQPAMAAATPAIPTFTPTSSSLSTNLLNWAKANGYGSQLSVSQWNWILNNAVVPGTRAELTGPGTPIDAAAYVQLLANDPNYDSSSITPHFGMQGYRSRTMSRAHRINYVRSNPALHRRGT